MSILLSPVSLVSKVVVRDSLIIQVACGWVGGGGGGGGASQHFWVHGWFNRSSICYLRFYCPASPCVISISSDITIHNYCCPCSQEMLCSDHRIKVITCSPGCKIVYLSSINYFKMEVLFRTAADWALGTPQSKGLKLPVGQFAGWAQEGLATILSKMVSLHRGMLKPGVMSGPFDYPLPTDNRMTIIKVVSEQRIVVMVST